MKGKTLVIVYPKKITIVTAAGAKEYNAHEIRKDMNLVQGDPYDFWIGRDEHGEILWEINCLIPCIIEY